MKWRSLYTFASISCWISLPLGEGTVQLRQTLQELKAGGSELKTGPQVLPPSQTWVLPPHVHCNPCPEPLLPTSLGSAFFWIWEGLSSLGKKDGWPHEPEPLTQLQVLSLHRTLTVFCLPLSIETALPFPHYFCCPWWLT